MIDYHQLVPLPAHTDINTGLTAAKPFTMLSLLGVPGKPTKDCSAVSPRLRAEMVTHKFNHFSVTGWVPAVDALVAVMTEVYHAEPELHALVGSAGMLCVRLVRESADTFSNHSWGTAIDLTIGGRLDAMGADRCQRGILMLYPYFHRHGFYWGAGFSRPDSMHFEASDESVRRWNKQYYG